MDSGLIFKKELVRSLIEKFKIDINFSWSNFLKISHFIRGLSI